jgi:hypothetical protein
MRYVPYHRLNDTPNVVVDGRGQEATVLALSHWPHSGTPWALKDDLSAQIVFRYLDRPSMHVAAEAASNNHFDEDGLVSVYALAHPNEARSHRDLLIDVAAAGDFATSRSREAARLAFTIAAFADRATSPLPSSLFAGSHEDLTAALYDELLGRLPGMLASPESFRRLWEAEDAALAASEKAIASGAVRIEEVPALDLAVVTLPEGERGHPIALHNATERFALLVSRGSVCELRYRYETWVQYVSRRPRARVDLTPLAEELSARDHGRWVFDGVDEITPRLHREDEGPSALDPALLRDRLIAVLGTASPAWDPYDPRPEAP